MKFIIFFLAVLVISPAYTQENLEYQKPPEAILELVDAPLAPAVLIDNKGEPLHEWERDDRKKIFVSIIREYLTGPTPGPGKMTKGL